MAATPMARPTMNRPRMRVVTSGAHPITTDPNVKRNDAPPITLRRPRLSDRSPPLADPIIAPTRAMLMTVSTRSDERSNCSWMRRMAPPTTPVSYPKRKS